MANTFKINPAFDEALFVQADLQALISNHGRKVQSAAVANAAAVGQGTMAQYITGNFSRGRKGRPHYYVGMVDKPDQPGSAIAIEFGTGDTPVHAILRRAIEAAR